LHDGCAEEEEGGEEEGDVEEGLKGQSEGFDDDISTTTQTCYCPRTGHTGFGEFGNLRPIFGYLLEEEGGRGDTERGAVRKEGGGEGVLLLLI